MAPQKLATMETTTQPIINLYEGSHQFKSIATAETTIEECILSHMLGQWLYRNTAESLWAMVVLNGREIARYSYNPRSSKIALVEFN